MAWGAAAADQIARHHRLAVPGRERVQRPPAEGGGEQQQKQPAVVVGAGEGVGEARHQRRLAGSGRAPGA